jgi:hypothetical protein
MSCAGHFAECPCAALAGLISFQFHVEGASIGPPKRNNTSNARARFRKIQKRRFIPPHFLFCLFLLRRHELTRDTPFRLPSYNTVLVYRTIIVFIAIKLAINSASFHIHTRPHTAVPAVDHYRSVSLSLSLMSIEDKDRR